MILFEKIRTEIVNTLHRSYAVKLDPDLISIGPTRKEFSGDLTVVLFPLLKSVKRSAADVGALLSKALRQDIPEIEDVEIVQGFLNISLSAQFWRQWLGTTVHDRTYGQWGRNSEKVMIEFSSPNTNKPLHLGHVRNILLGWSCSRILEAAGYEVVKVQVINDRGIAICKSMVAWQMFGVGATPATSGKKGDHFVGDFYVMFEQKLAEEYRDWQQTPEAAALYEHRADTSVTAATFFKSYKNQYFNQHSALGVKARALLVKWEQDDVETLELWRQMNEWVYEGFNETYRKLGVSFDKLYFESETWRLGKEAVMKGLSRKKFDRKEDGSVWVDLTYAGLDEKLLLRSDGTSVYMTQDIGTAMQRYEDYNIDRMVYVVADEQNYHFQVLFEILTMLDEPYADGLYHLSYGMVDLPGGSRMKTREGTVVDADDLMQEVIAEARKAALEKGDLATLSEADREEVYRQIGLAALKFFILKVNPQKRMVFDPAASVDLQGQTGPYIQNAFVRSKSILRKAGDFSRSFEGYSEMTDHERILLNYLMQYPQTVRKAASIYDPSHLAVFCYDLAKAYHRYYHDVPILSADSSDARAFRLSLCESTAHVLEHGMNLLGIEMPERM